MRSILAEGIVKRFKMKNDDNLLLASKGQHVNENVEYLYNIATTL